MTLSSCDRFIGVGFSQFWIATTFIRISKAQSKFHLCAFGDIYAATF